MASTFLNIFSDFSFPDALFSTEAILDQAKSYLSSLVSSGNLGIFI